jgi:UDP-4-amino-4,6-dideoxy-N-acetyl-beta-L-altrosamine transaminase
VKEEEKQKPLHYGRQSIDEDDIAAVVVQLRGDWLTQGPTVAAFEKALAEITGARFVVAVSNGTAALHLACLAAGVGPGDIGVTSDITFVASANGIRYAGGAPVLTDVDPDTGLMTAATLKARVDALVTAGKKPKVIIPVDLTGAVADLPAIRTVADGIGAVVIEDAAHSLGATYEHGGSTHRAGSCVHTEMAILSFHPVKHITTGEGGAITTSDERLFRTLMELRTHGITKDPTRLERSDGPWYYEQHALGYNYRITDIQCALGVSQARKLPAFVARRRAIAARYDAAFADARFSGRVAPLVVRAGTTSSYHLYVLRVLGAPETILERRLALFMGLRAAAVFAQVHYIPVHRQPDFVKHGLAGGNFPGADAYYAGCISLPMYPAMTDGDVDRVVESVDMALLGGA